MAAHARMTGAGKSVLRVMTYNIRQCLGMDRQCRPDRILRIIRHVNADVVALQEVSHPESGTAGEPFDFFRRETGLEAVAAPTHGNGATAYGNLLLSRWPFRESQAIDLSVPGREPRNAIRAIVEAPQGVLRIIATHLGLSMGERQIQMNALATLVAEDLHVPTVLLGDLNEWRRRTRSVRKLSDLLEVPVLPLSFPSRWPVFPLDQIWVRNHAAEPSIRALRAGEARIASDHLPLVADIAFEFPTPAGRRGPGPAAASSEKALR